MSRPRPLTLHVSLITFRASLVQSLVTDHVSRPRVSAARRSCIMRLVGGGWAPVGSAVFKIVGGALEVAPVGSTPMHPRLGCTAASTRREELPAARTLGSCGYWRLCQRRSCLPGVVAVAQPVTLLSASECLHMQAICRPQISVSARLTAASLRASRSYWQVPSGNRREPHNGPSAAIEDSDRVSITQPRPGQVVNSRNGVGWEP